MNEKKICACVGARTRDTQKSKEHYEENFIPAGWNLEYTCLDQPEVARALYLTGVCLHCGGQLGKKFNIPGELTVDALLEQIYHQMESCRPFDQRFDGGAYRTSLSMRAYWYMEQDDLTLGAKNAQFLKLFHAEDQGVVEDWISRCHAEEPYTAPRRDRKSTLLRAVLERARACGDLREIEPILDYYLPNAQEPLSSDLDSYLTNYQFSAIANISYGCEGIFVDLAIEGNFDDSGTNRCTIGTFKTLRQDNDAGRLMGQLCGILILQKLDLFLPAQLSGQRRHKFTGKATVLCGFGFLHSVPQGFSILPLCGGGGWQKNLPPPKALFAGVVMLHPVILVEHPRTAQIGRSSHSGAPGSTADYLGLQMINRHKSPCPF